MVCAIALIVAVPNFFSERTVSVAWPNWLPQKQFRLGIEFAGGTSLLLAPDMDFVQRAILKDLRDKIRKELRDRRIRYENLRHDASSISLQFRDDAQKPVGFEIVRKVALYWDRMPVGNAAGYRVRMTPAGQVTVEMTDGLMRLLRERVLRSQLDPLNCHQDWLSASREGDAIRLVLPLNFRELAHVYGRHCW